VAKREKAAASAAQTANNLRKRPGKRWQNNILAHEGFH
jgi:hypothetical protein